MSSAVCGTEPRNVSISTIWVRQHLVYVSKKERNSYSLGTCPAGAEGLTAYFSNNWFALSFILNITLTNLYFLIRELPRYLIRYEEKRKARRDKANYREASRVEN